MIAIPVATSGGYFAFALLAGVLYGDIGGPLNFVLVPVGSVVLGVGCCMAFFVVTSLLEALRRKWKFAAWLPVALVFVGGAGLFLVWATGIEELPPPAMLTVLTILCGAFPAFCFGSYWIPLMLARKIQSSSSR